MKIFDRTDIEQDGNEILVESTVGDTVELNLTITGGILELPDLSKDDQLKVLDTLIESLTRVRSAATGDLNQARGKRFPSPVIGASREPALAEGGPFNFGPR
jgi:hypothetical protein